MITTKNRQVEMQGTVVELLSEFTSIIESMHELLSSDFGEGFADAMIALAGRMAYMTDEEFEKKIEEIMK